MPKKFASKRRAAVNADNDDDGSGTAKRCRCVDVSVDEISSFSLCPLNTVKGGKLQAGKPSVCN